jgi:hypothetical protein
MPFDVFISYSSKDKPTADAACAALEGAGIRCWIAPRDIRPGGQYGAAIIDAIDSCRVMVLIFSMSANTSHQVPREIERAVSRGVPIVPLRIEEVAPTESMAYFLDSVHWLDALTPPLQKHLQYLVDSVRSFLEVQRFDTSAQAPDATADGAISKARDRTGQHDTGSKAAAKRLDSFEGDAQSAVVQGKPAQRMRTFWKPTLALGLSSLFIAILVVGYYFWSTSAIAQSAASVLKDFGLTGSWALDCSHPPTLSNGWDSYNAQPSGAVERRTDLGPGNKPNIYLITGAKNLGNNQVSMSVRFNNSTDEEIVISIIAGKERTVSTKLSDGTFLVQNGIVVRSGVMTPALTHCPSS